MQSFFLEGIQYVGKSRSRFEYLDPRLLTMNDVAQNETRSGRRERTINILWSSLQAFSHSPINKTADQC